MPTGFVIAARELLDVLAHPPVRATESERARVLLERLVTLQREALSLPELSSSLELVEAPPRREYDLRWPPFQYYRSPFDPFDLLADPGVGDLADDLTDIAHDLAEGLAQLEAGDLANAVWVWRFSFWSHWSEHLAGAVWALQRWLALRG